MNKGATALTEAGSGTVSTDSDFDALPFVRDVPCRLSGGTRRIVWCVKPTGNDSVDFETGVEYAFAFLEFEAKSALLNRESQLGRILHAMARTGDNSAIVTGFAAVLAEAHAHAIREPEFLDALRRRYKGASCEKAEPERRGERA